MHKMQIILLLVLLGLNLRPVMASIGPLTEYLLQSWHLSYGWISLLNGLPIIMMGLGALASQSLLRRADLRKLLAFALIVLGASTLSRLLSQSPASMIASAIVAGLGIAVVQVFLPIVIKRRWPEQTASYMGIYVSAIMAGAALSAALAPQIWHAANIAWALGGWGLLALPALLLLLHLVPAMPHSATVNANTRIKPGRFWRLAGFFGLGTSGFTCLLAWLPPHFTDLGYDATTAGLALSLLSTTEVISGLLISQLAAKATDRRPWIIFVLLLAMAGMACLNMGAQIAWLGVIIAGCGIGALFPLSLIVCMDHLEDAQSAGILTAKVQGVGYLIAGVLPMLAGLLRDALPDFTMVWLGLVVVFAFTLALAMGFDPRRYRSFTLPYT